MAANGATRNPLRAFRLSSEDDNGVTTAAVVPHWGGGIFGFAYRETSWAHSIPVLEAIDLATAWSSPTSFGAPLLAPTPGRVGRNQSGRFRYRGRDYAIEPSRHGLVRQAAWEVLDRSQSQITCGVEIACAPGANDPTFPFRFRAEHRIHVEPRRLTSRVKLENTGDCVQPLNVGWHPYLHTSAPPRIRMPCASRWQLDDEAEPTPTGAIVPLAPEEGFQDGRALAGGESWDDVLTDLSYEDGVARCWLEESSSIPTKAGSEEAFEIRRIVEVAEPTTESETRPVRNIQLYTPRCRSAVAIEPLSCPPDAINLLDRGVPRSDVCELEPGQSAEFEIAILIEAQAAQ